MKPNLATKTFSRGILMLVTPPLLFALSYAPAARAQDQYIRTYDQPLSIYRKSSEEYVVRFVDSMVGLLTAMSEPDPDRASPVSLLFIAEQDAVRNGQINPHIFPNTITPQEIEFFASLTSESDQCFIQSIVDRKLSREKLLVVANLSDSNISNAQKCFLMSLVKYSGENVDSTLGEMDIGSQVGFVINKMQP